MLGTLLSENAPDRLQSRIHDRLAVNSRTYRTAEDGRDEIRMLIGALLVMLLIFALDLETGSEIRLHVLYVFPISVVAFKCWRWPFIVIALAASVALQSITYSVQALSIHAFVTDLMVATCASLLTVYLAVAAKTNQRLAMESAMTDPLTNLANRRAFLSALNSEIARQKRYGGDVSLAILDLDGFKGLNDAKGHQAGDEALKLFASILADTIRHTDLAARIGGDEFALLMPNTGDSDSDLLCRKLCNTVAQQMAHAGFAVTTSVGCKTFRIAPNSVSDALHQVDELMYCAKRSGKNRVLSGPAD